jgi:predicted GIY-YIG superfamily endonuclease
MADPDQYYIYILEYFVDGDFDASKHYCFYVGITNNIERRFKQHEEGKCRTTNRFNKHCTGTQSYISTKTFNLKEALELERKIKKYNTNKKYRFLATDLMKMTRCIRPIDWKGWRTGRDG